MAKPPAQEAKKDRYRVHVRSTDYLSIDVLASDADEAYDIATNVDGGHFVPYPPSASSDSWEILCAEQVPPDELFHPLDERHYGTL